MRNMLQVGLLGITLILLAACGANAPEPSAAQPDSATTTDAGDMAYPPPIATADTGYPSLVATEAPMPEPSSTNSAPPAKPLPGNTGAVGTLLEAITVDFSTAAKVPVADVEVVGMEAAVWPDAGLGCPDPNVMYPQVMVEGLQITLQAGDTTADYHTEGLTRYVRCEDGRPVSSAVIPRRLP